MSIKTHILKLKSIDLDLIVQKSLVGLDEQIIKLNQDQMYEKGVMDVNNPSRKESYAKGTIATKKRKAKFPRTDHVTLRWDNDLYQAMKVLKFKDKIVINTTDLKWANWLEPNPRFKNAMGLIPQSMGILNEILKPRIISNLKMAI